MNDKFDLEEAITDVFTSNEELETLLYRVGDSPVVPSEDEVMNILIGIIALNKVRYEKLWNTFEALVANGVISNKNVKNKLDPITQSLYDDGTLKSNDSND